MKIQCLDSNNKKPLANYKFQVQVKGPQSGFLTLTSNEKGFCELEDKYRGQQIAYFNQGVIAGPWIHANEGAMFYINKQTAGSKEKSTTQSYK